MLDPTVAHPSEQATPTEPEEEALRERAAGEARAGRATPSQAPSEARERPLDGVDLEGFHREIQALRREIVASLGPDDLAHLLRIERVGRGFTALGLMTAWIAPNPVSALSLAVGKSTRWLLMHHVGHRGYDRVPGVPERLTSHGFAKGARRFLDWPDWMTPEAWCYEHNVLHHFQTGEEGDPDLIERNTAWIHDLPRPARWAIFSLLAATWRASYYAEATMKSWLGRKGTPPTPAELRRALLLKCWLPYAALQFGALPALFLPLGPLAAGSVLANSLAADVLTNLHTFLVVGPNHAGDDLYRFAERPASKAEHFARQVLGSVNYATGSDLVDFAHLWLNYQIEHHLFPDVPMLQYQRMQPRVKALCEKYGLPYVQEGVGARFVRMARVFVGDAKMRRA
jgi:fatty acid desaturase